MPTSTLVTVLIAIALLVAFAFGLVIGRHAGAKRQYLRPQGRSQFQRRDIDTPGRRGAAPSPRARRGSPILNEVVIIDLKTTGHNPAEDRIVSLAAVSANIQELIEGREKKLQYWQACFNPSRPIGRAASRVHGIDNDAVKDKESFRHHAESLLGLIGSRTIIAHNADPVVAFLKSELYRCDLQFPPVYVLCTMKQGAKMLGRSAVSLEMLARELGLSNHTGNPYDALRDAMLTLEVVEAMEEIQQGNRVSTMDVR